jgi:hypothetical protein
MMSAVVDIHVNDIGGYVSGTFSNSPLQILCSFWIYSLISKAKLSIQDRRKLLKYPEIFLS